MGRFKNFGSMACLTTKDQVEFDEFVSRHDLKLVPFKNIDALTDVFIEGNLIGYAAVVPDDNHFMITFKKGRINVRYLTE